MSSPPHNLPLAEKVAIVTGSSRGIGESIALDLARRGAKVMITYTSPTSDDKARKVVSQIVALENGSAAASVRADLALPESYQRIVDATLSAFATDTIDILVNNAGISGGNIMTNADVTPEAFNLVLRVNLQAPLFLMQAVQKHLPSSGGGRIINISSVGSHLGVASHSPYNASKAGLEALTRSWAVEFGPAGHTANAVSPGMIQSDMLEKYKLETGAAFVDAVMQATPMEHRLGRGEDIASIVGWLASEESRWITGQTIAAAGGHVMF